MAKPKLLNQDFTEPHLNQLCISVQILLIIIIIIDFDEPILTCCLNIYNILQPEVRNFEQELRNFYNSANSAGDLQLSSADLRRGFSKLQP